MKKLPYLIVIVILSLLTIYFSYRFFLKSRIKLAPPINPPEFSVFYIYNFYWSGPIEEANVDEEIEKDIKNIKAAGFNGIKINFYFREDDLAAEKIAREAARNGIYPIGQFVGHSIKPKDRAFTEREMTDWENFVREEVKKNKDIVYFWEVWNEPMMTELRFRYGASEEYLDLLKKTQKIIKEENPSAKVIVTADYTDVQAEKFTNEFLSLGGADYLDYLSFHPYNAIDSSARYGLAQTVSQEKSLSEKYGKPLWITEIGISDSSVGEIGQANTAITLFKTAYENKIPIVWFHWSDSYAPLIDQKSGWGLIRKDGSFKPSYESIKSFIINKN